MSETAWPNSNMRRLKRVQTEKGLTYTLETSAERNKYALLCEFCAKRKATSDYEACDIYESIQALTANRHAVPFIRTCQTYQPVLTFRTKRLGFEGEFNTIRIGKAWFNRLMPKVIVGLADAGTGEVFAKAEVIEVLHGDFDQMIDEHAYKNHMLLGISKQKAAAAMKEIIVKAYGKLVVTSNSEATVIYLRNTNAKRSDNPISQAG